MTSLRHRATVTLFLDVSLYNAGILHATPTYHFNINYYLSIYHTMSVHSDLGPPTDPMEKTIAALALSPDSAINSTSNFEDGPKEHVLEPVSNFPGAYPGDFDQSDTFTADDAKKAAIGVLHTAAQYIPTQQDVEKAMLSASEKAKQYLPSVVTSYLRAYSFHCSSPVVYLIRRNFSIFNFHNS